MPEPVLEAFVAGPTSTTLIVPIEGGLPEHEYAIDVFANAHCDKPGEHGPMEVFLGSGDVTTDSAGEARAEIDGPGLGGIDAEVFTATATDLETGTTGGIGHCAYSPIDTKIETEPPALSGSSAATFTFVGETVGHVEGFECSLDGAAFAACTSPKELTGLSDGSHEFKVRAVNGEGNVDLSPATYEWTVDTAPPEVTITAGPSGTIKATNAKFEFTATDAGSTVTAIECKLDAGAFEACASPKEYTGLADGSHTFEVRATDEAGNTSTPVSRTWKVDTEPPEVTITAGPSGTTNIDHGEIRIHGDRFGLHGRPAIECKPRHGRLRSLHLAEGIRRPRETVHTRSRSKRPIRSATPARPSRGPGRSTPNCPQIEFTEAPPAKTNSTEAIRLRRLRPANPPVADDRMQPRRRERFARCESPQEFTGLAAGTHTFEVRAEDAAGNVNTVSREWKIVTEAPSPTITAAPPATTETDRRHASHSAAPRAPKSPATNAASTAAPSPPAPRRRASAGSPPAPHLRRPLHRRSRQHRRADRLPMDRRHPPPQAPASASPPPPPPRRPDPDQRRKGRRRARRRQGADQAAGDEQVREPGAN